MHRISILHHPTLDEHCSDATRLNRTRSSREHRNFVSLHIDLKKIKDAYSERFQLVINSRYLHFDRRIAEITFAIDDP